MALFDDLFEKDQHHDADYGGKTAAVAIVFDESRSDPALLMMKRAIRTGDPWSGHMAFPGGRFQQGDRSLLETAVRETYEEVGLHLELEQWKGGLSMVSPLPRRELAVSIFPQLFAVKNPGQLKLNEEAQAAYWIPLSYFFTSANAGRFTYEWQGKQFDLPCYRYRNEVIWGLSYRILINLLEEIIKVSDRFGDKLGHWPAGKRPWPAD